MKIFLCVVFISSLIGPIYSWVGKIEYKPQNPIDNDLKGAYCFTTAYGLNALDEGEVKRLSNTCAIGKCGSDRSIYLSGCGVMGIQPPCYIGPGDLSKPYPDCCFEIHCPDDLKANKI